MNRRDAIMRTSTLMGSAFVAPWLGSVLSGCSNTAEEKQAILEAFTPEVKGLIAEIADTIIPTTGTPGAKEAKVQDFIADIVADCFNEKDRKNFFGGLTDFQNKCQEANKNPFEKCDEKQRIEFLTKMEQEGKDYKEKNKDNKEAPAHIFGTLKSLTLTGYFTSEIGASQALEYLHVPGKYEGCVPLKAGQKAWAT
ncbi:MAG: gluconate 2-dehydrogenase subunit 3 family protein [Cytophagales bacterium]|nr:MAG: gluconate 2-dehydrogenase subunit 3 family protein [Cytophagales bacterium]